MISDEEFKKRLLNRLDKIDYELTSISNYKPILEKIEDELAAIRTNNKSNYEMISNLSEVITTHMHEVDYKLKVNSKNI